MRIQLVTRRSLPLLLAACVTFPSVPEDEPHAVLKEGKGARVKKIDGLHASGSAWRLSVGTHEIEIDARDTRPPKYQPLNRQPTFVLTGITCTITLKFVEGGFYRAAVLRPEPGNFSKIDAEIINEKSGERVECPGPQLCDVRPDLCVLW